MLDRMRWVPLLALCAIALGGCGGSGGGGGQSSGPAGASGGASAALQWSASTDGRVRGYRVYYGSKSGIYDQTKGAGLSTSTTSYVVGSLVEGQTYFFAVTSYDTDGNESDYSGEVSKVVN